MAPSGSNLVTKSHSSEGPCVHLPQPFGSCTTLGTTEFTVCPTLVIRFLAVAACRDRSLSRPSFERCRALAGAPVRPPDSTHRTVHSRSGRSTRSHPHSAVAVDPGAAADLWHPGRLRGSERPRCLAVGSGLQAPG